MTTTYADESDSESLDNERIRELVKAATAARELFNRVFEGQSIKFAEVSVLLQDLDRALSGVKNGE